MLILDPEANADVTFGNDLSENSMLGDITKLEGAPWDLCMRARLKTALERLQAVAGVHLVCAFEHEFQHRSEPALINLAHGRECFQVQRRLCETLMAGLERAARTPDSVMKEYRPDQYEAVVSPAQGLRAADEAVILRGLTRSAKRALGEQATFTPIRNPASIGNCVHIHARIVDDQDAPATYAADGPFRDLLHPAHAAPPVGGPQ